uniref:C-type lectin domain-containing protein n=1 Tax=Anabas testudineus TaxID=64144 RepID=A0A3Q1K8W0_ANATE
MFFDVTHPPKCPPGWLISSTCLYYVQYHYVSDEMTWPEAQIYCRQNHTDLAPIKTIEDMNQICNFSFSAYEPVWTGLYSRINWTWSDGYTTNGTYNVYLTSLNFLDNHCVYIERPLLWFSDNCSAEYPFICYRMRATASKCTT